MGHTGRRESCMSATPRARLRARTVFLSDVHLGFRGCQADYLLDFLRHLDAEHLVLVGDIVDLWSMKRSVYWPVSHHELSLIHISEPTRPY